MLSAIIYSTTLMSEDRQAIWTALGLENESGHFRRTTLTILASQYVLPMWDSVCQDDIPNRILTMTIVKYRDFVA
jgi:hypothetical protein